MNLRTFRMKKEREVKQRETKTKQLFHTIELTYT